MDTQMIVELIGYAGSALVLVSFLMSSVVKLRVINMIGGMVFGTYAVMIRSYPTAIMQALSCDHQYLLPCQAEKG